MNVGETHGKGLSELEAVERLNLRPTGLLTQNSNLRRDRIWNWCLPAWAGRFPDGRTYNTCPSAGICAKVCYARSGSYRFRNVLERHQRNLAYVLDDLPGWTEQMIAEIGRKRGELIVRVHDAGDFFSDEYLTAWLAVMAAHPGVRFYAYTKEVERFRRMIEPGPPPNFKWVYSYGGTQDHLLHEVMDRVCDVFPTTAALQAAGYNDQEPSDLLAVDGPAPVGMAANNIPHFLKKQGGRTFRTWQAEAERSRPVRGPLAVMQETFGQLMADR
jgi:hypothetical protein